MTATTSAPGSVLIGGSLNYLKFKAFSSASGSTPTIYVYGWNFCSELMAWVPQLLVTCTGAVNTVSQTLPVVGAAFEVTTYTRTGGDAKIYSADPGSNGGFFVVDTLGCEFVEIVGVDSVGAKTLSFLVGSL